MNVQTLALKKNIYIYMLVHRCVHVNLDHICMHIEYQRWSTED